MLRAKKTVLFIYVLADVCNKFPQLRIYSKSQRTKVDDSAGLGPGLE